ncbi:MAG: hypothetical protein E7680_07385 [Ruminococcaceae bacterium]|nr:hypothetical protein [Oscillospiraceae bacterium]
MKHSILKIALLAGTAYLIVKAVKKTKEAMEKQAEADAAMAEEVAAEAVQNDGEPRKAEEAAD